ncbi:MAG: hypothetical protein ACLSFR_07460 [Alphaproteobacteria bacterium]
MRYSSLLALCAFMLCLNAPEVRGEILAVHTYDVMTHTALLPKPVASDNTFSLAATWWLPDWQGSQGSRGSADDGGGDIVKDDSDCMEHYNLYAICPSPKLSTGIVHPVAGMTCQKGCICPSEYIYSSSNCAGEYQVSGTACDGKYNTCSPKPCSSGGYYAEQQTERICSAVTYGGRTCYSCYQPQCSAGGYETATQSGYRCSAVAYYGRTCYSCKNDTCPSGYGKSSCGSAYHQTGTAKTEAGATCYACAAHNYSLPQRNTSFKHRNDNPGGRQQNLFLWCQIRFLLQRGTFSFLQLPERILGNQFMGRFSPDCSQDLFLRCCFGNLLQSSGAHPQLQLSQRVQHIMF